MSTDPKKTLATLRQRLTKLQAAVAKRKSTPPGAEAAGDGQPAKEGDVPRAQTRSGAASRTSVTPVGGVDRTRSHPPAGGHPKRHHPDVTDDMRAAVKTLAGSGKTNPEIAKELNLTPAAVRSIRKALVGAAKPKPAGRRAAKRAPR